MKKTNQAFTLVELIVVITILAILGTIAFISLQGYSKSARDSTRISDVSNMKTSLELFHLNAGKYPLPDSYEEIVYDTDVLWYQGVFGNTVISQLSRNIHEEPTDPLTEKKYVFSVANNKNEFEILSLLESDLVLNQTTKQANAATLQVTPRIDGYFNGVFIKTANYIVPVPSLITAEDVSSGLTLDGINIKSQIISGGSNIPNYGNVNYNTGGLVNLSLSVYTGTVVSTDSDTKKAEIMQIIQAAYTGSELVNNHKIAEILSKSSVDDLADLLDIVVFKSKNVFDSSSDSLAYNFDFLDSNKWFHQDDTKSELNFGEIGLKLLNIYSSDLIPSMTSNTSTDIDIIYSTVSSTRPWWKAFQDTFNGGTDTIGQYETLTTVGWVGVYFKQGQKIITKYTLRSRGDFNQTASPYEWYFEASNDGIDWTELDYIHYTNSGDWSVGEHKEFVINNSNSYSYYRVRTLDSFESWINIDEIEMMESSNGYVTVPYYVTTLDTNQLDLSGVGIITSVNIDNTEPTNTSIKALVSFDGRNTWKMWDGSSWVEKTLGTLQEGSSISQMEAGLTNYNITSETSLDFAFDLSTSDGSVTPSIGGIVVGFEKEVVDNTGDPNIVLMIHGEENISWIDGNTFNESSSTSGRLVTINGGGFSSSNSDTTISFGGVTGEYLSIPDSEDFEFGVGNYTVEMRVYPDAYVAPATVFFGKGPGDYHPLEILMYSAGQTFVYSGNNTTGWDNFSALSVGTIPLNQWTHVAIVQNNNVVKAYKNGELIDTKNANTSRWDNVNPITIGNRQTGDCPMNGDLDEIKVSNIARYNIDDSCSQLGGVWSCFENPGEH